MLNYCDGNCGYYGYLSDGRWGANSLWMITFILTPVFYLPSVNLNWEDAFSYYRHEGFFNLTTYKIRFEFMTDPWRIHSNPWSIYCTVLWMFFGVVSPLFLHPRPAVGATIFWRFLTNSRNFLDLEVWWFWNLSFWDWEGWVYLKWPFSFHVWLISIIKFYFRQFQLWRESMHIQVIVFTLKYFGGLSRIGIPLLLCIGLSSNQSIG